MLAMFPRLSERYGQAAGTLSGGEQQMLAIARCLMGEPQLVMFDEPSLGLAPTVVQQVLATIRDLNRQGLTCVLVEQNVAVSLKLASRAYVLENGRVTLSGTGAELLADDRVRQRLSRDVSAPQRLQRSDALGKWHVGKGAAQFPQQLRGGSCLRG